MSVGARSGRDRVVVLGRTAEERPPGMEPVEERCDVVYTDAAGLAEALPGAAALLLWDYFSTALRDAWPRADRLRWVHVTAAGVDTLLFEELVASDVVVTNARGVFDRPIAEFVLAAVLAHAKDLRTGYDLQREHRWEPRETALVAGTTALVVGTGSIGREISRLLRAVGMHVRGAGRSARGADPDFGEVVASADLAEHVGWADHLVVVAPLTPATRGLVDRRVLDAMKPTAHLVNVGRGASVVETDLLAALAAGRPAAATLDVFEIEPLPPHHPLWASARVTVTPHMSGDAAGSRVAAARQLVDNALRWLDGEPLRNVVDKRLGFVVDPPREDG